jgi:hypothetical protein
MRVRNLFESSRDLIALAPVASGDRYKLAYFKPSSPLYCWVIP